MNQKSNDAYWGDYFFENTRKDFQSNLALVVNRAIYTRKNKTRLYHLYEHVLSNKTRLSQAASYFRRNVPFIRKVRVLFKTRLIFPRINGPILVLELSKGL